MEEEKKADMINTFWDEFQHFHNKTGSYADRSHIWNHQGITNDASHNWHLKHSVWCTKFFGKFACIACSKSLGISSAERCWEAVKEVKSGQRSHMGSETTMMTSTLKMAWSAEKQDAEKICKETDSVIQSWDDDDFECLGLTKFGVNVDDLIGNKKPKRIFCNWLEDWEEDIMYKQDPSNEHKLLKKYAGLSWYDPDQDVVVTACTKHMKFIRQRKIREYNVPVYFEGYDSVENPDAMDYWAISDNTDLYDCISEWYQKNPDPNIVIVEKEDDN
jgi:hypothetical protein